MDRDDYITSWLRRRKIFRRAALILLLLLIVSVLLDHTSAFGYSGNDFARFDHQTVTITRVVDGDAMFVRQGDEQTETALHLLGIDAPHPPADFWADRAEKYLSARASGRTVTLRLDPVGWRNDRGELLAYVYITDADNLNLDIIHDGQAYADRRTAHSLHAPFEEAEKEARQKKRGLWKDVTDSQQPAWRQAWLKSRGL